MQQRAALSQRQPLQETNEDMHMRARIWSVAQGWWQCTARCYNGACVHMRSAVGNWKAVFTLFFFHLLYITRQYQTRSNRRTLHQRSPGTHKPQYRPRPRCTCARKLTTRAVLALGTRLVHARTRIARARLAAFNLCRALQNAAGSGEVVKHGGEKIPSAAEAGAASAAEAPRHQH
jgi:hypothetical protein